MSDINVDNVTDSSELENTETSNTVAVLVGSALVGVAGTLAVRFVVKKFRARKEAVHVVTEVEDETLAN